MTNPATVSANCGRTVANPTIRLATDQCQQQHPHRRPMANPATTRCHRRPQHLHRRPGNTSQRLLDPNDPTPPTTASAPPTHGKSGHRQRQLWADSRQPDRTPRHRSVPATASAPPAAVSAPSARQYFAKASRSQRPNTTDHGICTTSPWQIRPSPAATAAALGKAPNTAAACPLRASPLRMVQTHGPLAIIRRISGPRPEILSA